MKKETESLARQSPAIGNGAPPTPGLWYVDPWHTSVTFVAGHLKFGRVRGKFNRVSGTVEVAGRVEDSEIEVAVDVGSVDTGVGQRDKHLLSEEFFDVARYPEMGFSGTRVEAEGTEWTLRGDLSIHGVTRPVAFEARWLGQEPDLLNEGEQTAAFSARVGILRSDFGIGGGPALPWGGNFVADDVVIEVEVALTTADPAPMLGRIPVGY